MSTAKCEKCHKWFLAGETRVHVENGYTHQICPSSGAKPSSPVPLNSSFSVRPNISHGIAESAASLSINDMSSSFSLLGVKFSYFKTFIDECGGEELLCGLTTAEVDKKYVFPRTSTSKLSLCEQLLRFESKGDVVGTASWFVSHAWRYKFLDVVESIELFLAEEYENRPEAIDDVILWFDLFSNSQHDKAAKPFEWWRNTFTNAIKSIGNVMMVLLPWDDPITLTRAWCVFEVYACCYTRSRFAVSMTREESARFAKMMKSPGALYNMLAKVKSQKSTSYLPDDRDRIFDAVRRLLKGGFTQLDSMVLQVLQGWMVSTLQQLIDKCTDDVERADVQMSLAQLFQSLGKYDRAEPLYTACLEARRRLDGNEHADTLATENSLALLLVNQGRYEEAEPLYQKCLETCQRVLGNDHPQTLAVCNNLALLCDNQGRYEQSEALYLKCVETSRRVLGDDHPETLSSQNNLALSYDNQGKLDLAEPLYVQSLASSRRVLGDDHPQTLNASNNLAELYRSQKKYKQAEPLYKQCLETCRRVLGNDHPLTLATMNNLALLYDNQGMFDKAEPLYLSCLESNRHSLGDEHPQTLISLSNLAELYYSQGKYDKAEPLHASCLEARRRVLGEDHEDTLASVANLEALQRKKAAH